MQKRPGARSVSEAVPARRRGGRSGRGPLPASGLPAALKAEHCPPRPFSVSPLPPGRGSWWERKAWRDPLLGYKNKSCADTQQSSSRSPNRQPFPCLFTLSGSHPSCVPDWDSAAESGAERAPGCVCMWMCQKTLLSGCLGAQMHSCGNYKGRARQAGGQSPLGSSRQPPSAPARLINPPQGERHGTRGRRLLPAGAHAGHLDSFGNQEGPLSPGFT